MWGPICDMIDILTPVLKQLRKEQIQRFQRKQKRRLAKTIEFLQEVQSNLVGISIDDDVPEINAIQETIDILQTLGGE